MPKRIVFVSANSRLGLINPPNGETNPNVGVETAPATILSTNFLQNFPNSTQVPFSFTAPEAVAPQKYLVTVAEDSKQLVDQISKQFTAADTLVTIGGDHSISLTSLATIAQVYNPSRTGVIMIDSHTDIHQPSTSPSGNFHGMWLRPVMDQFENKAINDLIPKKLLPKNLIFIGNLDIEPAEKKFLKEHNVQTYNRNQLISGKFTKNLDQFLNNIDHLHLSIDIDAFSHTFAPATGMHIANGLEPLDVFPVLEILKDVDSLSVDLVEVNPVKKCNEKTVKLAQELLLRVLK